MEKQRALLKSVTLSQDEQCRWKATCEYQLDGSAHVAVAVVPLESEILSCATVDMCRKITEAMDSNGYTVAQHGTRLL